MKRFIFRRLYTRMLVVLTLFAAILAIPAQASGEHGDGHADGHEEHESFDKGPHGGQLLTDGDISVELALTSHGNTPRYQAWIVRHGTPVDDQHVTLNAKLIRLDGETIALDFKRDGQSWRGTPAVAEPHSFDVTLTLAISGEHYEWTFASYEGRIEIAAATAAKAGVNSEIAGPGPIKQTLTVYGKSSADPAKVSHLRARFPGTITRINVNIGERVKAGQVLAEVESSDSLRRYELQSPLTGVVVARDGNPGELALQQALLTVANYDLLWIEFLIFPGQANKVIVGQSVGVYSEQLETQSTIQHLLPDAGGQPFLRARVPLDNTDGQWVPGQLLTGAIATQQTDVPLRVKHRAIQQIDGQDVVFIRSDEAYEARAVTLGISDGQFTEIVAGLRPGVRYVSQNSYLIKADLGKSGAAHNH